MKEIFVQIPNSLQHPGLNQILWNKLLHYDRVHVQARLDDAEQNALKGGKKAMAKMDSRIR